MFSYLPSPEIIFIAAGVLCLYLLIAAAVYGKKLIATWGKMLHLPIASAAGTPRSSKAVWSRQETLPPLIDKPADHPVEQTGVYDLSDEVSLEFDDDAEITLLKEAERVVAEIQYIVDRIESRPANPEEVFTKIRALVSDFTFFQGTEYYDAINSFIAVTVQRDCDLLLTEDDLKTLWYSQAA